MTAGVARAAFPAERHDHGRCLREALATAEAVCAKRGARFTELRRRVLEIVWAGHRPLGAYDILDSLGRERGGAAPPTVYRALEFLLEQGLIHRLESLNAYIGCTVPGRPHGSQFLICRACGRVAELDDARIEEAIRLSAETVGFTVERKAVEATGLCPRCRHD
ncbi:MAG: transcriptional repressor [Magnetospirillum sp. WYHS-4]